MRVRPSELRTLFLFGRREREMKKKKSSRTCPLVRTHVIYTLNVIDIARRASRVRARPCFSRHNNIAMFNGGLTSGRTSSVKHRQIELSMTTKNRTRYTSSVPYTKSFFRLARFFFPPRGFN